MDHENVFYYSGRAKALEDVRRLAVYSLDRGYAIPMTALETFLGEQRETLSHYERLAAPPTICEVIESPDNPLRGDAQIGEYLAAPDADPWAALEAARVALVSQGEAEQEEENYVLSDTRSGAIIAYEARKEAKGYRAAALALIAKAQGGKP